MVLFVNGCVRKNSRTLKLAQSVLERVADVIQIKAEGLDIWGSNPTEILEQAKGGGMNSWDYLG